MEKYEFRAVIKHLIIYKVNDIVLTDRQVKVRELVERRKEIHHQRADHRRRSSIELKGDYVVQSGSNGRVTPSTADRDRSRAIAADSHFLGLRPEHRKVRENASESGKPRTRHFRSYKNAALREKCDSCPDLLLTNKSRDPSKPTRHREKRARAFSSSVDSSRQVSSQAS
ncbi:hypothetical protein ALC62_10786 [Cyphomyrmex costatus]|uniref:Uncharacterized protein n=1 Tax=Cyphomyrmex costatus TaxID=456900 RepID=A0A151IDK5_9HYME|nr:hypothetical protein ALC62_10786 [Cyphomyrmex costatus]